MVERAEQRPQQPVAGPVPPDGGKGLATGLLLQRLEQPVEEGRLEPSHPEEVGAAGQHRQHKGLEQRRQRAIAQPGGAEFCPVGAVAAETFEGKEPLEPLRPLRSDPVSRAFAEHRQREPRPLRHRQRLTDSRLPPRERPHRQRGPVVEPLRQEARPLFHVKQEFVQLVLVGDLFHGSLQSPSRFWAGSHDCVTWNMVAARAGAPCVTWNSARGFISTFADIIASARFTWNVFADIGPKFGWAVSHDCVTWNSIAASADALCVT